jgi:hypothetical protein
VGSRRRHAGLEHGVARAHGVERGRRVAQHLGDLLGEPALLTDLGTEPLDFGVLVGEEGEHVRGAGLALALGDGACDALAEANIAGAAFLAGACRRLGERNDLGEHGLARLEVPLHADAVGLGGIEGVRQRCALVLQRRARRGQGIALHGDGAHQGPRARVGRFLNLVHARAAPHHVRRVIHADGARVLLGLLMQLLVLLPLLLLLLLLHRVCIDTWALRPGKTLPARGVRVVIARHPAAAGAHGRARGPAARPHRRPARLRAKSD